MYALRAHNSIPFLKKKFRELKKMDLLMYALRAFINRTHL